MVASDTTVQTGRPWSPHLRGHFLQFDARPAPALAASAGVRLLLTAALLEAARLAIIAVYPAIPLWLLLPLLMGAALLAVTTIGGVALSQIGLVPWREWSATEKSYTLQIIVFANIIFTIVLGSPLAARAGQSGAMRLWTVFVPYLFFGFYQEVVYRGMVQGALVRRWGAVAGIVVANILYTFGPLHWNYFAVSDVAAAPMFAAIFGIGLLFGVLYQRSGNLWIVGLFHAIGNAYIVSSLKA